MIEVAHRFQLTPWSYFQPDIQYVIDPGGTGDIPNALVIGAQMGFTFLERDITPMDTPSSEHRPAPLDPRLAPKKSMFVLEDGRNVLFVFLAPRSSSSPSGDFATG